MIRKKYPSDFNNEYQKKYVKNHPWAKYYYYARTRCLKGRAYHKRGIKFLLTMKQVRYFWFKDGANKMKKPSIDRINSDKNYSARNVRFIELSQNLNRQAIRKLKEKPNAD